MKLIYTSLFFLITAISINAQINNDTNAIWLSNSATNSLNNDAADSSLYYIRKLGAHPVYGGKNLFTEFIHNSFVQPFGYHNYDSLSKEDIDYFQKQVAYEKRIIAALKNDTSQVIKSAISPLSYVIQIQDSINDYNAVTQLVNGFIKHELSGNIYQNRQARYGLYIYNLISANKQLSATSEKLLTAIEANLLAYQMTITSNRLELVQRAWYRYLYAYACSKEAEKATDANRKKSFLHKAAQYSPDVIDMSNKDDFFYDMMFLTDEEKYSFQIDYLRYLQTHNGNKEEILLLLSDMAMLDTNYKQELKTFFAKNYVTESFDAYWLNHVSKDAKKNAPEIQVSLLNKNFFSSKKQAGKWILVDFWGTWCGPCRMEHPDLEKFYRTEVLPNSKKISLLTIACRDTETRVVDYMKEKGFSFPVAISDGDVEKQYQVQSYPTKILITPSGNYLLIPLGFDWTNYVKEIVDL